MSFVQRVLGCGCPPEVIRTARLSAEARPLKDYLAREAQGRGWPALVARLNKLLRLPAGTPWPGGPDGTPRPAWHCQDAAGKCCPTAPGGHERSLARLKRLCSAQAGLLIDVPQRALFVLAVSDARPIASGTLADLHEAASLVKELGGYNRVRLFTLSRAPESPLPSIHPFLDAALDWDAVLALLREAEEAEPEPARTSTEIARLLGIPG